MSHETADRMTSRQLILRIQLFDAMCGHGHTHTHTKYPERAK